MAVDYTTVGNWIKQSNSTKSNYMSIFTYTVWILLLLLSSGIPGYDTQSEIKCDGVFYRDNYYDKHMLFETTEKPYNMFYDVFSGELMFSHTIQYGKEINFQITTCHIKKQVCREVEGVPGGYAIGYDYVDDEIYLGGHQGIYKYNFETNRAEYFAERGKSIWSIFIRRNFYYIQHPAQQLYVFKRNEFVRVRETAGIEVDNFFVSRRYTVYFSNRTGLFKARMNRRENIPYLLASKIDVRQIVEDLYGTVHFCASDGIYIEDNNERNIKKVANIHELFSIAFMDHFHLSNAKEKNQLIYANDFGIYVLTRNNQSAICSKIYKSRGSHNPVRVVKVTL